MTPGTVRAARPVVSAALAGAASGARSLTGPAALALAASRASGSPLDRALARPWAKAAIGVLAAQEYLLDKLPSAPSRLRPPGLAARLAGAAAAGALVARRTPRVTRQAVSDRAAPPGFYIADQVPDGAASRNQAAAGHRERPGTPSRTAACILASLGAATATAWLGSRWRSWASTRLGQDWMGASLEDVVALILAATAAVSD
jgi:uncharacterized membrane protein